MFPTHKRRLFSRSGWQAVGYIVRVLARQRKINYSLALIRRVGLIPTGDIVGEAIVCRVRCGEVWSFCRMENIRQETCLVKEHRTFFEFLAQEPGLDWCCAGPFALCEYMLRNRHRCVLDAYRPHDCQVYCVFPANKERVKDLLLRFSIYSGVAVRNVNYWPEFGATLSAPAGVLGVVQFDLVTPSVGRDGSDILHKITFSVTSGSRWHGSADSACYARFIASCFDFDVERVWIRLCSGQTMGLCVECYDEQTEASIVKGTLKYAVHCGYTGSGISAIQRIDEYLRGGFKLRGVEYVSGGMRLGESPVTRASGSHDEGLRTPVDDGRSEAMSSRRSRRLRRQDREPSTSARDWEVMWRAIHLVTE